MQFILFFASLKEITNIKKETIQTQYVFIGSLLLKTSTDWRLI